MFSILCSVSIGNLGSWIIRLAARLCTLESCFFFFFHIMKSGVASSFPKSKGGNNLERETGYGQKGRSEVDLVENSCRRCFIPSIVIIFSMFSFSMSLHFSFRYPVIRPWRWGDDMWKATTLNFEERFAPTYWTSGVPTIYYIHKCGIFRSCDICDFVFAILSWRWIMIDPTIFRSAAWQMYEKIHSWVVFSRQPKLQKLMILSFLYI